MINNEPDGLAQFLLSLILGGGFLAFSVWAIQSFVRDQMKIRWLNQNGEWIHAKMVEIKSLTKGKAGESSSCKLILEPADLDVYQIKLKGVTFESEPLPTWLIRPSVHTRKFDVCVDNRNPGTRHFVNLDVDQWASESDN